MDIDIDTEGFDELENQLEQMERAARDLDGENEVPFPELFPPSFMRRYTDFSSIDEMLEESPFTVETQDDFEKIPVDEWDEFVDEHTRFPSWEKMMGKAGRDYVTGRLGL